MSTHLAAPQSARSGARPHTTPPVGPSVGPAELVARIVLERRDALLRVHAHRLGREDLEDCLSQAAFELLARARHGAHFDSPQHIANALNQKLMSRICDRRRALSGRSAIESALARATSTDDPDGEANQIPSRCPGPEELVARRAELARIREVSHELSSDQRLWLAMHGALGMGCEEFCRVHGWSAEKFRKVGQRARRRLALLLDEYAAGERCRRLQADLFDETARTSTDDGVGLGTRDDPTELSLRVRRHLANCSTCRCRLMQWRADRARAGVPAAGERSDQHAHTPMITSTSTASPRRDRRSRPRGSRPVPIAVHGGRSGDLAALRPAVHVPLPNARSTHEYE